jgi:thioredoxin-like negative regulator of GroEL
VAAAERDRKWQGEAPRKAMLIVFGLIGVRHPLADEFRKKLMFIY